VKRAGILLLSLLAMNSAARAESKAIAFVDLWAKTCGTFPTNSEEVSFMAEQSGLNEQFNTLNSIIGLSGFQPRMWSDKILGTTIALMLNKPKMNLCTVSMREVDLDEFMVQFNLNIRPHSFVIEPPSAATSRSYSVTPELGEKFTALNLMVAGKGDKSILMLAVWYNSSN